MLLSGKVALVTGAGRGIGTHIARLLASEGAQVAVHYNKSREPADTLAAEIGGVAFGADLSSPDESEKLAQAVIERFQRVDILVNNAASFAHDRTFQDAAWQEYADEFAGVVGVTINPTRAVVPHMIRQGGGRIVNFMATLLQRPAINQIVHATAKSALLGFTRTLARDLGPHHITVNMVSPGLTMTDYSSELPEETRERIRLQTPLRRLATPDDVARVVLFYCSDLAGFVTGANIAPDGGLAIL